MSSRSLGHRAPLLWLALPMMAGLVIGRHADAVQYGGLLAGALVLAIAAHFVARWTAWWAIALGAAMLLAGTASYALHRARLPACIEGYIQGSRAQALEMPAPCMLSICNPTARLCKATNDVWGTAGKIRMAVP